MLREGEWKSGVSSSEKTKVATSLCVHYLCVHFIKDQTFVIPTPQICKTPDLCLFASYQRDPMLGEVLPWH